jgi:hypothetical protein
MTKTYKNKLQKVCKILFPQYKHIAIKAGSVTFYKCKYYFIRDFFPKWRVSLAEMIQFRIPSQLADFKYGNKTFINVIQDDLVKCELTKTDKVDYFLNEIVRYKYSDLFKELKLPVAPINLAPEGEDELFNTMVQFYQDKKKTPRKSYFVSKEAIFYAFLLLIVAYSLLT